MQEQDSQQFNKQQLNRIFVKQSIMSVASGIASGLNLVVFANTGDKFSGVNAFVTGTVAVANVGLAYKSRSLLNSNDSQTLDSGRLEKVARHLKLSGEALISIAGITAVFKTLPAAAKILNNEVLLPKDIAKVGLATGMGALNVFIGLSALRIANRMETALTINEKG